MKSWGQGRTLVCAARRRVALVSSIQAHPWRRLGQPSQLTRCESRTSPTRPTGEQSAQNSPKRLLRPSPAKKPTSFLLRLTK